MDPLAVEWLHLLLRWFHVIAAIAWIGHAFLFNWLDSDLVPPDEGDPREGLEGELYMVHGGGFYRVEKSWVYPERLRGPLHWFKWEAGTTWISGVLLLIVVYHLGGGVYLVDPTSGVDPWTARAVALGTIVVGWLVYDLILCKSPLVQNGLLFGITGFLGLIGIEAWLGTTLSGRAAYIHTGALMGTLMAGNVWVRIIPAMKAMVASVQAGGALDEDLGKAAKQRSRHNNYLVFPLIFIMISNHYPAIYGSQRPWLLLAGIGVLAVLVKHAMNLRGERIGVMLTLSGGLIGAVAFSLYGALGPAEAEVVVDTSGRKPIVASETATLTGEVRLTGEAPARREITLFGGCEAGHDGPILDDAVLVSDGRVQNAFVWLSDGTEAWEPPPVPAEEAVIDQRGCLYDPRVAGVRVGQKVVFLNSDPLLHNVRAVSDANPVFNDVMPTAGLRLEKVFRRPDVMLQARCDVHPWMSAWLGVLPHPWFAVTDAAGAFTLEGVPPGTYTLEAWHEVLGRTSTSVEVTPGGTIRAALVLGADPG